MRSGTGEAADANGHERQHERRDAGDALLPERQPDRLCRRDGAGVDVPDRIAERQQEHRRHAERRPAPGDRLGPDQHRHAGEPNQDAEQAVAGRPLRRQEGLREDRRQQRARGLDQRRRSTVHLRQRIGDEDVRPPAIDGAEHQPVPPLAALGPDGLAERSDNDSESGGCAQRPDRGDHHRGQFAPDHLHEQEGRTPADRAPQKMGCDEGRRRSRSGLSPHDR